VELGDGMTTQLVNAREGTTGVEELGLATRLLDNEWKYNKKDFHCIRSRPIRA
jgi:hypothetical protein